MSEPAIYIRRGMLNAIQTNTDGSREWVRDDIWINPTTDDIERRGLVRVRAPVDPPERCSAHGCTTKPAYKYRDGGLRCAEHRILAGSPRERYQTAGEMPYTPRAVDPPERVSEQDKRCRETAIGNDGRMWRCDLERDHDGDCEYAAPVERVSEASAPTQDVEALREALEEIAAFGCGWDRSNVNPCSKRYANHKEWCAPCIARRALSQQGGKARSPSQGDGA